MIEGKISGHVTTNQVTETRTEDGEKEVRKVVISQSEGGKKVTIVGPSGEIFNPNPGDDVTVSIKREQTTLAESTAKGDGPLDPKNKKK